jgi:hypothetical protein
LTIDNFQVLQKDKKAHIGQQVTKQTLQDSPIPTTTTGPPPSPPPLSIIHFRLQLFYTQHTTGQTHNSITTNHCTAE